MVKNMERIETLIKGIVDKKRRLKEIQREEGLSSDQEQETRKELQELIKKEKELKEEIEALKEE